jgi:hydrogenase maturation protease
MPDLREQLQSALRGRVCFMGVGNVEAGDDAFGVRLAEALERNGVPDMVIAGTEPERLVGRRVDEGFDQFVFLDAVEFGASPGSAVLLDAGGISARFPQFSTHKISLGVLADFMESGGHTRAWLLGVQPASLQASSGLSPAVATALTILAELISEVLTEGIEG